MINQTIKSEQRQAEEQEVEDAIAEYLKNGGTVTKCKPFARTENLMAGQWGRKNAKKKVETSAE
jgi:hypothetical protein